MVKLVRKPSPAMVVACLALFVALTGTSVAVVNVLPKNSVGTAQLKKDAVVSSKIKDASLKAVDFAAGQLPKGATGPTGATGAAGPKGEVGPKGDSGANAALSGIVRTVVGSAIGPNTLSNVVAPCLADEIAIAGGGWTTGAPSVEPVLRTSAPSGGNPPVSWTAVMSTYGSSGTATLTAFVVCVKKPQP
jgi:hypothetical protein